jgi:hypothetical protein
MIGVFAARCPQQQALLGRMHSGSADGREVLGGPEG